MTPWEAPKLREGFDHRGHQCNSCGMHHCHMSVIRQGAAQGQDRRRAGVRGLVGRGLDDRRHRRQGRGRLAQHAARPRVPRRERVRLAVRLGHGGHGEGLDHEEAARLRAQVGRHRRRRPPHPDDLQAGGLRRPARRRRQARLGEARRPGGGGRRLHHEGRLAARPRSPRALGGDARHLHLVHRHHGDRQPRAPDGAGAARAHQSLRRRRGGQAGGRLPRASQLRGLAGDLHLHDAHAPGERLPRAVRGDRAGTTRSRRRCARAVARRRSIAPSRCAAA